jgi:hypothetical protein
MSSQSPFGRRLPRWVGGDGLIQRNKQPIHAALPEDDSVAACQAEFREFQELVTLFEATASAILEATSRLEAAPGKLTERLARSTLASSQHAKVVQRLVGQLADFTMALKQVESQVGELQQLVQESRDVSAKAQQLTQLHEEAWSKKVKSDNDVEELIRDKRHVFTVAERKERLAAHSANSEAWESSKDRSKQDSAKCVDVQRALSVAMTLKLHGLYSSFFQQSIVSNLGKLVHRWTCSPAVGGGSCSPAVGGCSCSPAVGVPVKDSGELVLVRQRPLFSEEEM